MNTRSYRVLGTLIVSQSSPRMNWPRALCLAGPSAENGAHGRREWRAWIEKSASTIGRPLHPGLRRNPIMMQMGERFSYLSDDHGWEFRA